jgi:RNA polymerase sigma-70 factor (ECF subfamily)
MENPASSAELVQRWRDGDQQAATTLWLRYAERLLALARKRLSGKLARHVDPEDVVQSAYRSFFAGARDDRFVLARSGDLWRLLVAITLHKLNHQVKRMTAQKRGAGRAHPFADENDLFRFHAQRLAHEPAPSDVLALTDELQQLMREFPPLQRHMVELRLQGYCLGEIADLTQRSERTVRRVLERMKRHLKQRCQEYADS